jgi:uncharacterized membrane protein YbhN (UPF0104 family)
MRKTLIKIFKQGCAIGIVLGLVYYLYSNWDSLAPLYQGSFKHIAALSVLVFVNWFLNSVQTLILLRACKIKVGVFENFWVMLAGVLGNYLPLHFGTIVRIRYFKHVHSLSLSEFGGILGIRILVLILSVGILGGTALTGMLFTGKEIPFALVIIFFAVPVLFLGLYWSRPLKIIQNQWLTDKLSKFEHSFHLVQRHPRILLQVLGISLVQYLSLALRLYISFDSINISLSPFGAIFMAPVAILAGFFAISPGNLGLREWLFGVISVLIGDNFKTAVFAGTIDRAVLLVWTFTVGLAALLFVLKKTEDALTQRQITVESVSKA